MSQYLIGYPEKTYPRLTHFGYSDEPRDFDSGMHRHVGYEFVFFFRGSSEIRVKEHTPPLFISDDDLLIMSPDVPHKFATPPKPLMYSWLGFQGGCRIAEVSDRLMFPAEIELDKLPPEELRFTDDIDPEVETISSSLAVGDIVLVRKIPELQAPLEQIRREILEPRLYSRQLIHLKILELLTLVLRKMNGNGTDLFDYAAEYIRARCGEALSLPDIAGKIGYQPSYFSRKFSERFGISPLRFLRQCRIDRAKVLLASGGDIRQTSDRCGFQDFHYFSSVFRKETGFTPASYRRAAEEDRIRR